MIYADNAATTPLSSVAYEAMLPYLTAEFYNPSTRYSTARKVRKAVEEARYTIAECINASPEEIFFTSGGTESDNWAIKGTMLEYGDHRCAITDTIEHHAVLNSCSFVERMGYPVVYLTPDSSGVILPSLLEKNITENTKLVSIMMVNNELGTIQPIRAFADIAHNRKSLFHTDAVQAVGHLPIDVKALCVDMLSASAHKFGGPKGIGFLYVRKGTHLGNFLSGGSQERGLRAGTENVASIVGMASALLESCSNMEQTTQHLKVLREYFIKAIHEMGIEYQINGGNNVYPGIISLSLKDFDGEMILYCLDLKGIQIATGSACDSNRTQVSHVLSEIGLPEQFSQGTIRISFGVNNTVQEVDVIIDNLRKILLNRRS